MAIAEKIKIIKIGGKLVKLECSCPEGQEELVFQPILIGEHSGKLRLQCDTCKGNYAKEARTGKTALWNTYPH